MRPLAGVFGRRFQEAVEGEQESETEWEGSHQRSGIWSLMWAPGAESYLGNLGDIVGLVSVFSQPGGKGAGHWSPDTCRPSLKAAPKKSESPPWPSGPSLSAVGSSSQRKPLGRVTELKLESYRFCSKNDGQQQLTGPAVPARASSVQPVNSPRT